MTSAGVRPAAVERRLPDRHVAAVDDDDDRIRQDPDEDEDHARVPAVRPQRHEEEPERGRQQREPQRLDEFDAALRRTSVAKQERDRQQRSAVAEAGSWQVDDVAAGDQAEHESEDDAADQHRVGFTGHMVEHASRGRARPGRRVARSGRGPRVAEVGRGGRRGSRRSPGRRPSGRSDPIGRRGGLRRSCGRHPVGGLRDERDLARLRTPPGSGTPSTWLVLTKASTTTGSNWTPANLRSSPSACSSVSGVMR